MAANGTDALPPGTPSAHPGTGRAPGARPAGPARPASDRVRPVVLLVEDESSIAEPFAQALSRNGFEPILAASGEEALERERSERPDIVLLDLALPDVDGRDVCRRMREDSQVPIIMVTARGTVTDRIVGLELGADDYIVKPFATGEAISRIKAVLRRSGRRDQDLDAEAAAGIGATEGGTTGSAGVGGGVAAGSAAAQSGGGGAAGPLRVRDLLADPASRRVTLAGRELQLTRKELDLLLRLMRDAGRVVTRETLMSEVWDENWFGSTKTLDVHIAALRRKLHDSPEQPSWIHTVRGVGFRFAEQEEDRP